MKRAARVRRRGAGIGIGTGAGAPGPAASDGGETVADRSNVWVLTFRGGDRDTLIRADAIVRISHSRVGIEVDLLGDTDEVPIVMRRAGQAEFPKGFALQLPAAVDQAVELAAEREESVVVTAVLDKDGDWLWRAAKLPYVDIGEPLKLA
jgi:hypothetical protein